MGGRRELLPHSALRDWVETILVAAIFVIFARSFAVQQSAIPSGSMEDTVLIGDYVLVNRLLYAATTFGWERWILPRRDIRRGDVVVFAHPDEPERDFIKRVIGLPGERVELRNGTVLVDGRELDEPYLNPLYRSDEDFGPLLVAADRLFLLGDHRSRSSDSRSWGTVPGSLVKGRAFLILLSADPGSTNETGAEPATPVSFVRKLYELVFRARWDRVLRPLR